MSRKGLLLRDTVCNYNPSVSSVTLRDVVRCPVCSGVDVVYTCEPKCCFNHVCADCRATFQLGTRKSTRPATPVPQSTGTPDSSDPTAACVVCESLRLAVISAPGETPVALLCSDCGAVLELTYSELAEG